MELDQRVTELVERLQQELPPGINFAIILTTLNMDRVKGTGYAIGGPGLLSMGGYYPLSDMMFQCFSRNIYPKPVQSESPQGLYTKSR